MPPVMNIINRRECNIQTEVNSIAANNVVCSNSYFRSKLSIAVVFFLFYFLLFYFLSLINKHCSEEATRWLLVSLAWVFFFVLVKYWNLTHCALVVLNVGCLFMITSVLACVCCSGLSCSFQFGCSVYAFFFSIKLCCFAWKTTVFIVISQFVAEGY